MSATNLFRLAGLAAMLCGICIIGQRFLFDALFPHSIIRIGTFAPQLGLFAITGLYLWQKAAFSRVGDLGFIINFIGLAYLGCVDFARHYVLNQIDPSVAQALLAGPTRLVFLTIGVVFVIGVMIFGIAMLRAGKLPRGATILYMIGFVPFALSPFFPVIVITATQISAAVGVIWLGFSLWSANNQQLNAESGALYNEPA